MDLLVALQILISKIFSVTIVATESLLLMLSRHVHFQTIGPLKSNAAFLANEFFERIVTLLASVPSENFFVRIELVAFVAAEALEIAARMIEGHMRYQLILSIVRSIAATASMNAMRRGQQEVVIIVIGVIWVGL